MNGSFYEVANPLCLWISGTEFVLFMCIFCVYRSEMLCMHVDIIMLHVDINKSHTNKIILRVAIFIFHVGNWKIPPFFCYTLVTTSGDQLYCSNIYITFIPALSKESSGILLLPLSVRPSVRSKEKFVTGTPSTF